jgi:type IV pilus assembly protein PilP
MGMTKVIQNKLLILTVATLSLTACEHDFSDLQQYIANIKARSQQAVKPLPEFKSVEPFVIKKEEAQRDPFKPVEKIKISDVAEDEEEPDNGIHPDSNRKKEPLESYPLTAMKMVGTINMQSVLWALIRSDNTIYRVKVGEHLGKNDGRITNISKNKIELIEIVPSKPGRFIEQPATLTLAE